MSEQPVKYDALEASYHREVAAPLVFPQPKFSIGQLFKDDDGDLIQIIGLEWHITDEVRGCYWKYVIWDIALGCVLDLPELMLSLDSYILVSSPTGVGSNNI